MVTPNQALAIAFDRVTQTLQTPIISDEDISAREEFICRNIQNRAGVRLLLACLLAKVHRPEVDIRKPYTEIGTEDSFSGRTYDEVYLTPFIQQHHLPCNPTTAFLTPALRNRNTTLTVDLDLVGRPPRLYQAVLELLDVVHSGRATAEDLLAETIRWLLIIRDEQNQRRETLLAALRSVQGGVPLSAETIVNLIQQHLNQPRSSRLPVLAVAAAYQAASPLLGEKINPLESHNAADYQTKALGDLEITLINDQQILTVYEMKAKTVIKADIDRATQKLAQASYPIDNYIFITTEPISEDVKDYALSMYELTNGVEIVILDCLAFLRHFLHLFHRLRMPFLDNYQALILAEPESAVSQALKEVFLTLRQMAEGGE